MRIRKKKTGMVPDRIPPFTHVVPLGLSCRVTRQVRVCFGSWKVYPFDWWLTPLDGLTRYLAEPDVGRLYDPGSLAEVITRGEVSSICSTVFGFRLFHDFPRRPGANKLAAVVPGWRDHVAAAAARHEERLRRRVETLKAVRPTVRPKRQEAAAAYRAAAAGAAPAAELQPPGRRRGAAPARRRPPAAE